MKSPKRPVLKSESGTTMVEVLVAFVVLLLLMGIFSQAMNLAGRMLGRTDDMLENYRELAGGYYLENEDVAEGEISGEKTMAFIRTSGRDEGFSIQVRTKTCTKVDGDGKLVEVLYEASGENGE